MNFVIPISIAKQFLNEKNVTPAESQLTKLYKEGLAFYNAKNFSKALEKFREVNELNPGYPYIQTFISDSRQAINNNQDESGTDYKRILLIAGAVAGVLVLVLLLLLLLRRFNFKVERKSGVAAAGTAAADEVQPETRQPEDKQDL